MKLADGSQVLTECPTFLYALGWLGRRGGSRLGQSFLGSFLSSFLGTIALRLGSEGSLGLLPLTGGVHASSERLLSSV